MIPAALVKAVIGWGVPEKFAKPLIVILAVGLLFALIIGGIKLHDRGVIEQHDAKREASQAKDDRIADNKAAEQRRVDDARIVKENEELKNVQTTIADPVERKRRFYECIRLQQAARRNGQQPPACV